MKIPRINLLSTAIMCFTGCAVLLVVLLSGCASTQSGRVADAGVHADHGTTAVGLTMMGATELNPLAPLAPIRYWLIKDAETKRCDDRRGILRAASASGWGAAGWNVLMLVAAPQLKLASAAIGGALGAIGGYQSVECEAVPASAEQLAILDRWEAVYEAGDSEAMRGLLTDADLAEQYADLFARTERRDVEYQDVEAVRDGIVARFTARLAYSDGTTTTIDGDMRFALDSGRVREAGRI